jgi:hypothetical protein
MISLSAIQPSRSKCHRIWWNSTRITLGDAPPDQSKSSWRRRFVPSPFISKVTLSTEENFKLFAIPTTMFASYLAIRRIFMDEFLARENNFKLIESREVANFERTLVPDRIEKNYFTFSILT